MIHFRGRCPICREPVMVFYDVIQAIGINDDGNAEMRNFFVLQGTYPVHPECKEFFVELQREMTGGKEVKVHSLPLRPVSPGFKSTIVFDKPSPQNR